MLQGGRQDENGEHSDRLVASRGDSNVPTQQLSAEPVAADAQDVIHSVSAVSPVRAPLPDGVTTVSPRITWKSRVRSFLCCFGPDTLGAYYRSTPDAEAGIPNSTESLIGEQCEDDVGKKTLVLDLDETLVHSSFKPIPNPDLILPVEINGRLIDVYVLKRPWLDHFLKTVASTYEIVVFTASLKKYADPLLDMLDKSSVVRWRLFRECCHHYQGNYVKDLNRLGRRLASTIIIDNSPHSYVFQPENALPISTFIDCMDDCELLQTLQTLQKLADVPDVRKVLPGLSRSSVEQLHPAAAQLPPESCKQEDSDDDDESASIANNSSLVDSGR